MVLLGEVEEEDRGVSEAASLVAQPQEAVSEPEEAEGQPSVEVEEEEA